MLEVVRANGRIGREKWSILAYPSENAPTPKAGGKAGLARNTGEAAAPTEVIDALVVPGTGKFIVPLALWQLWQTQTHTQTQTRRDALRTRIEAGEIAVWLDACEEIETLVERIDLNAVPLLALNFPKAGDGRACSSAVLLRRRYRYDGPLWAIGDVQRDYFGFLFHCGFDTLVPRAGRYKRAQLLEALVSLEAFAPPCRNADGDPRSLWRRARQDRRDTQETHA
jgi:uncharacterized protein (DUF934 family)